MRWIVVFLLLYLVPMVEIFRNNKSFRRSCIYSSIYIVLVTTIVITNIYVSGLNKIKDAMYYQNYLSDNRYEDKYTSNFDNSKSDDKPHIDKEEINKSQTVDKVEGNKDVDNSNKLETNEASKYIKSDEEIINDFKKEVYEIEKIALIPMRDCMPYTKNIAKNLTKLNEIKVDIEYARKQCDFVIEAYEKMDIPNLSRDEYKIVLDNSRGDLVKAYELREKAMSNALRLIETKNIKYIGRITEALNLSDEQIASFKERIDDLKDKIK